MLFSSAIAANVIKRFRSTWRSFSRRMAIMNIMHEPHAIVSPSLGVYLSRKRKEISMKQGNGLQGKRVVVLGGSSGIGLAVAEQASSQGANVVVGSSNPDRIQKAVQSLGGRVEGQTADLSDEGAIAALFTRLGPIDHLVFTAADSLQFRELAD